MVQALSSFLAWTKRHLATHLLYILLGLNYTAVYILFQMKIKKIFLTELGVGLVLRIRKIFFVVIFRYDENLDGMSNTV